MPAPSLESIQPYVEQLFEDSEVQKQLDRAAANLRAARSRAGSAKSSKQALQDPRLRHRLLEGARAAVAAGVAIKQGPEKKQRRGRRGRRLALVVLAAGGFAAANAGVRSRLLGDRGPSAT
jgi:hypothetical protein